MLVSVQQSTLVAQWVLLAVIATLVLVAFRQLAFQMRLSGASTTDGIDVGSLPAPFRYRQLSDGEIQGSEFTGEHSLVVFADPGCPACELAMPLVSELSAKGVTARVFSTAPDAAINTSPAFANADVPIGIIDRYVLEQYRVRFVPYAYLIGPDGKVLTKGALDGPEALQELIGPLEIALRRKRVPSPTSTVQALRRK